MMAIPDRITMTDVRNAGHCPSGTRDWFVAHNLDFRDFLKNGIATEQFLAEGDALAQQVVERKMERESDG